MDYSRLGVVQKQKELKSNVTKFGGKIRVWLLRIVIFAFVAFGILGVMAAYGAFNAIIDTSPDVSIPKLKTTNLLSTSYYADGTKAQNFIGAESNRIYVEAEDIPKVVQQCFVAIEDERFYEHNGIDIRTIIRAGVSVVTNPDENVGGSTITQQLLKNCVFDGGQEANFVDKLTRKIQEQYLAIKVEDVMSKDQIFEYYVNLLSFGNGANGIATAAKAYFDKDLKDLTLSEAAVLAPLALSPVRQNPINHPEVNAKRRETCIKKMYELGFCSYEEAQEAFADDVYTRIAEIHANKKGVEITDYSYFTDAMFEQVTEDLMDVYGYTHSEAQNLINSGGISIYTTQDKEIQQIVDSYYLDESNFPKFGFSSSAGSCYYLKDYALSVYHEDGTQTHYHKADLMNYFAEYKDSDGIYYHKDGVKKGIGEYLLDLDDINAKIEEFKHSVMAENETCMENLDIVPQPQSTMTIMDQYTGEVVAIVGGRGEKKGSLGLNRATSSGRSAGSTFKVLASFLPAIDAGGRTLASVENDSRHYYPNGGKEVINWYSGFRGLQSLRKGISNSLNIVAVKNLETIGKETGFEYLKKFGISTLQDEMNANGLNDHNYSIALGGLTNGVTNLDMTGAYAAIANGGYYIKPRFYTKVLDKDGNVILDVNKMEKYRKTQIMKNSTAWLVTDAMHDTTTVGTGTRLAFKNYKMHVAGKTGTASKNTDFWFAGFTPYYTAAVWTGFDMQFSQWNKTYQQDLWRNIMEEIHKTKQLEDKGWEMPESIVKKAVCSKCGKLYVEGLCNEAEGGSCYSEEYFALGTAPTQKCDCHVRVTVCKSCLPSYKVCNDFCPEKKKIQVVLLNKHEEEGEYTWDTDYVYHPENICDKHPKNKADDGSEEDDGTEIRKQAEQMGAEDDTYDDSTIDNEE